MEILKSIFKNGRNVFQNFFHLGVIQVSNALIQILLFPFIIRVTGLEAFGPVVVANSFAALLGLLVNFGTSISGVQAVADAESDTILRSRCFSQTILLRLAMFVLLLIVLPIIQVATPAYFMFIALSLPIVMAEIINPLYFFNGTEQLLPYNLANLAAKLISAILILILVDSPGEAVWVNFYLGIAPLSLFLILNGYLFFSKKVTWQAVNLRDLIALVRKNLPLVGNNLSVQLQQSFFLFVLSGTGNAVWLGAYAIVDKVLWGFRLILIAFSNALFPRAVAVIKTNPGLARQRKQQINIALAFIFTLVAFTLYFEATFVVKIFAGADSVLGARLVRAIAFVPLLAAMNVLNVMELLVLHRYQDIFKIAVLLTCVTVAASLLIVSRADIGLVAWYPFIVELAALTLYMTFLTRKNTSVSGY